MRNHIKQQTIELIQSMVQLHTLIYDEPENSSEYINLCYNAADSIIASIENECDKTIKALQAYKTLWDNILSKGVISDEDLTELNDSVDIVLKLLNNIKITYHIVFFPYNSSMWDCLESVYFAALKDESCTCTVVPIPYYKYDSSTKKWVFSYDGASFPENIPIVHYDYYDISKMLPDVAYIHNPYDDLNYVTRVGEDYFTFNLKKYVNKLVYIPYYLRSDYAILPLHKLNIPSYHHIDYIIKQSEPLRNMFEDTPFYNKMVALGSPKVDKILRLQEEGVSLNAQWEQVIKNRKTIMVNLTIGSVLRYGEITLKKVLQILELAKQHDVVIVFRPHPLLKATIEAMRPEVKNTYEKILQLLRISGIGIIDETSDIAKTAIICDAYMGCYSGSGAKYFINANKPTYNIDYLIDTKGHNDKTGYTPYFRDMVCVGGYYWCVCEYVGFIFKMSLDFKILEFVHIKDLPMQGTFLFNGISSYNEKLLLLQKRFDRLIQYDCKNGKYEALFEKEKNLLWCFCQVLHDGSKLCYIPTIYQSRIVICDLENNTIKQYDTCVKEFLKNKPKNALFGCLKNDLLYAVSRDTADILQLSVSTGTHKLIKTKSKTGFSHILSDGNYLWMACSTKAQLVRYNLSTKITKIFYLPLNIKISVNVTNNNKNIFWAMHKIGDYIVLVPGFSSCVCAHNVNTNESFIVEEGLFAKTFNTNQTVPVCRFSKALSQDEILIQREFDRALFAVNVKEKRCKEVFLSMEQSQLEKLKYTNLHCSSTEVNIIDNALTTPEEFISYVQNKSDDDVARQPDMTRHKENKTAGQRIHEFIMNEITKQ